MTTFKPPGPLAPALRFARTAAVLVLDKTSDGLAEFADLIARPPVADPADLAEVGECPDCGDMHDAPLVLMPRPAGMSPEERLLAAVMGPREGAPESEPPVDERTWRPGFADEIRETDVIQLLDGRPRPLRVVRLRHRSPEYGMGPGFVVLHVVDESGEAAATAISADAPVRIAVEVPVDAASLTGGAA